MTHTLPIRVYYEDTDLAGIVYYANYLKFIERGRSEWVREMGIDQSALKEAGYVFAVRRVEADYLSPAKFDDQLIVETVMGPIKGAQFTMNQRVLRGDQVLFTASVMVVVINAAGRAARLPADIRRKLTHAQA